MAKKRRRPTLPTPGSPQNGQEGAKGNSPQTTASWPSSVASNPPKLLRKINIIALWLKCSWRRQHAIHVAFSVIGLTVAAITLLITLHGFYVYLEEAPKRASQARLLQLQTINSAWETIRDTKGAQSERGQTFALSTLVQAKIALENLDVHGMTIGPADLQGADLYGADFESAYLTQVNLDYATLAQATADNAIFDRVSMKYATGIPSSMQGAFLIGVTASHSSEPGLYAIGGSAAFQGAIIVHSNLDLFLMPTNFHQACLVGVGFVDIRRISDRPTLRLSNFSEAVIYGGSFRNADLSGADFRGARSLSCGVLQC
jgi:uncharacterized protein YjbI with pentapeptide repeats